MKILFIAILLLSLVASKVFATNGGTNSAGCHHSKTAGYHSLPR